MPFYLKEADVVADVKQFQSALIVPCRFCPAASLSLRNSQPFIEFFRRLLKTKCYEDFIRRIQARLKAEGVRTEVFRSSIFNYVLCLWSSRKREKLRQRASKYDAVVVMGCERAYEGVRDMIESTDCKVFRGMESDGSFSAIPRFSWPLSVSLELSGVTKIRYQKAE